MAEEKLGEARYYRRLDDNVVECQLCPWHCRIPPGKSGRCGVRRNIDGVLRAVTYGRVTAVNLDPIEKKPLYHFCPGAQILSLGSWGCNLSCVFCQNWTISQQEAPTHALSPQQAVKMAAEMRPHGNIGIAYTYNEPMIWFEYVYDTAKLAKEQGLKNVLVTNGIVEPEPLEELLEVIDALNVDIKSLNDDFYRRLCRGSGEAARRTVEMAFGRAHVEVTYLVVTGENDTDEDFKALAEWVSSISPQIPVHISRYFPAYQFSAPPTPIETLERAYRIVRDSVFYTYVGNAHIPGTSDTVCPRCGTKVIERYGYSTRVVAVDSSGRCARCGQDLNISMC